MYRCRNQFKVEISVHDSERGCISFMMPVFNKAKYLNRSIGSVLGQNHQCIEVIAVDDGSTDNSNNILKYWMNHDKRVLVHTFKNNKGNIPARIKAVLLSIYDNLFSIDPDDELPSNCLKDFMSYALKTNSDMVMGRVLAEYKNGSGDWNFQMNRVYMNRTQMISLFTSCNMNWNLFRLIKRKVFMPAVQILLDRFYVPILNADDRLMMGSIILFSNNFSYYSKPTYIYYFHLPDNSRSNAYFKKRFSNKHSSSLVRAFLLTLYPDLKC